MQGLSSVGGGGTGLKAKEVMFVYFEPALSFRGIVESKNQKLSGGISAISATGTYLQSYYGGTGNKTIYVKALKSCKVSVYKSDSTKDGPLVLLTEKKAEQGEIVYSSAFTSKEFFLVEAQ